MSKKFYSKQYSLVCKTVLFQAIQFSINTLINTKTDLFQAIQFSISTSFSSISPIDRTLSGATISSQSGPGSNGNEGYSMFLKIPTLLEPIDQIT